MSKKKYLIYLAILAIVLLATLGLGRMPPLWWDEGWTMTVARNWVEYGYYGRYLDGQPDSAHLAAGFPVIVPVALSFRMFGIGVWQARLPSVLFLFASMVLLYALAQQLYNRQVAAGAIAVVLLMSVGPWLNPLVIGRQVLSEMPTMFYLLAGYALFLVALRRSTWFILPTVIFWAIALRAKAQVPPFWLASLLLPFVVAVWKRWWRPIILLVISIVGAHLLANYGILRLQVALLTGHTVWSGPIAELYSVTAFVWNWHVRLNAISTVLTFGLPTLLGLMYVAWRALILLRHTSPSDDANIETVRLALMGLVGSWLTWYMLFGMSYARYLFVVVFVGSIFTSALMYELTCQYCLRKTILQATAVILHRRLNRSTLGSLLAVILIAMTVPFNLITLNMLSFYNEYNPQSEPAAVQVAAYLNNRTPSDTLIETYESELFFLLNRRYHYPPDDIHVALIRRNELKQDVPVEYDPMAADPDYLVVGNCGSKWHLYDTVLESGAFRKIEVFPGYQIYERVR